MRNTDKRRDILDLKIGKSVKYTAAAFSGAFMHLTFLVIFAIIQLYVMVIFNVFSVGLYIVLGMICKRENFERRAYNWISAIYFEIALHSFFCTLFLGVNTCFFLYTMMTIPVMLYYLFLTCEKRCSSAGRCSSRFARWRSWARRWCSTTSATRSSTRSADPSPLTRPTSCAPST